MRALLSDIEEGFAEWTTLIEATRHTHAGALLVTTRMRVTSRDTNIEFATPVWQEITFQDDLILSVANSVEPPPAWGEAAPMDLGTPDTGT